MLILACILSIAHAEDAWAKADVELLRWPDKAYVSAKLGTGDQVEVLVHDGEKVRVRKGTDFGWIAAASLSPTVVEKPEATDDFSPPMFPGMESMPVVPSPVPSTPPGAPALPAPK